MSVQAMAWAMDLPIDALKSPTMRHVLLVMANYAGEDGRGAFPAVATVMRQTGLSRRAILASVAAMNEAGLIVPGNAAIAAAWIGRADKRPTVWDLAMPRGAGDAPRSPSASGSDVGAKSDAPGQRGARESGRGAGGAPDPLLTYISMGELPDWLTAELWSEWAAHRHKRDRRGWTAEAAKLSLRTLTRLRDAGHDPRAVIEQSIEHGWTGLFPVKPTNEGANNHASTHRPDPRRPGQSAADRVRDANRRHDERERAGR